MHLLLILVFRKGEIVERGSHEELLNEGGYYKDLFYAQSFEDTTKREINAMNKCAYGVV